MVKTVRRKMKLLTRREKKTQDSLRNLIWIGW